MFEKIDIVNTPEFTHKETVTLADGSIVELFASTKLVNKFLDPDSVKNNYWEIFLKAEVVESKQLEVYEEGHHDIHTGITIELWDHGNDPSGAHASSFHEVVIERLKASSNPNDMAVSKFTYEHNI
jgi:hypothetical protein